MTSRLPHFVLTFIAAVICGEAVADVTLYSDDKFRGRSLVIDHDARDLGHGGNNFNDKASSVIVRNGPWELCTDQDYNGDCVVLDPGEYPSLRPYGLNDKVSSAHRMGHMHADIVLFQDDNFDGEPFALKESASNLAREGFNDKASSVIIKHGEWELCNDKNFGGQCVLLQPGRYPSLRQMGLNDKVSSVRRAHGH
jgi:Beta/Gamma crystallin